MEFCQLLILFQFFVDVAIAILVEIFTLSVVDLDVVQNLFEGLNSRQPQVRFEIFTLGLQ